MEFPTPVFHSTPAETTVSVVSADDNMEDDMSIIYLGFPLCLTGGLCIILISLHEAYHIMYYYIIKYYLILSGI